MVCGLSSYSIGGMPDFAAVMIADDRPAIPAKALVSDAPLTEIILGGVTVRTRGEDRRHSMFTR